MSKLAVKMYSGDPEAKEQKTEDRNYGAARLFCFICDFLLAAC